MIFKPTYRLKNNTLQHIITKENKWTIRTGDEVAKQRQTMGTMASFLLVTDFRCKVIADMALAKFVRYLNEFILILSMMENTVKKLTRRGTSLLSISCTTFDKLELFEKLTKYFRLNVRLTD